MVGTLRTTFCCKMTKQFKAQRYEQSEELKNQTCWENSAYLSHLTKFLMEWRGKAEAMLENALERYVQWEETKADGAGGFLYIKVQVHLPVCSC
jgi:hypothetical protein